MGGIYQKSSETQNTTCLNITLYPFIFFVTEMERRIRMGPIEFISSLGGLFGLCLGFSFISFFEIIYWATIALARCHYMNNICPLLLDQEQLEKGGKEARWGLNPHCNSQKHNFFFLSILVVLWGNVQNIYVISVVVCSFCSPRKPIR